MNKIYNFILQNFYSIIFILIILIFLKNSFLSFEGIIGDKWAYQELFINYEAGFIRRGVLGQLFLEFNNFYKIEPYKFFTIIFILAYSSYIYVCFKIFKKILDYKLFYLFVILSPSFILFNIYDLNTFLAKDIFTNLSIALHALYIVKNSKKINIIHYNKFLLFFLIPILFLNILNY